MFNLSNLNTASAFVNALNVAQEAEYNYRKPQRNTEEVEGNSSVIAEYTHKIVEFFQSLKTPHIKST